MREGEGQTDEYADEEDVRENGRDTRTAMLIKEDAYNP